MFRVIILPAGAVRVEGLAPSRSKSRQRCNGARRGDSRRPSDQQLHPAVRRVVKEGTKFEAPDGPLCADSVEKLSSLPEREIFRRSIGVPRSDIALKAGKVDHYCVKTAAKYSSGSFSTLSAKSRSGASPSNDGDRTGGLLVGDVRRRLLGRPRHGPTKSCDLSCFIVLMATSSMVAITVGLGRGRPAAGTVESARPPRAPPASARCSAPASAARPSARPA